MGACHPSQVYQIIKECNRPGDASSCELITIPDSYQKKSAMVSSNVGSLCSPRGTKKPNSTQSPASSSPIPRSALLVKRASLHERESTPAATSTPTHQKETASLGNGPSSLPAAQPLRMTALLASGGRMTSPQSPTPTRMSSILKRSSLEEPMPAPSLLPSLTIPVSILKRKTIGEGSTSNHCHSPLRFSPNTVDRKGRGILKKHRSLDETQVANGNLELTNGVHDLDERRPILKAQTRRCSLEEVVKRTLSPEPQGILKRKTSSDETELPTDLFHTPHGILKKPSVTEEPLLEALDCPRPILKKKSSSEEEEFPVKPILKVSSRKSIEDEAELTRDDIKPILKHPEDSPGVVRRPKKSAGAAEKRVMSLDLSLFARPSSGGEGRPLSVAERVNGLESLLAIKRDDYSLRMEEGDGSSEVGLVRRGSVTERATIFNQLDQKEKAAADAAKSRRTLRGTRSRSRAEAGSRFCTQPVTLDEVEQAKRNNDPDCEDDPSNLSLAQRVKLFSSLHSSDVEKSTKTTPTSSPNQPARKLVSTPIMSGVLVEGLLKNLAAKDGAPPVKLRSSVPASLGSVGAGDSSSAESSDSEDECVSVNGGAGGVASSERPLLGVCVGLEPSSEEGSPSGRETRDILSRQT
ncbi:Hypothetical protein NTJ_15740 [Nesidiocoris tenuis]|uniref:CARMIL C-terminal domain-containing protein n=1 Tax=Nesidiocoris tenuis TaxID=355587 RepID=A0ABN7BF06_9HEMI|nr:Hypothetical protein NTJ_15740 [Nesidiocoris tenuis]